MLDLVTRAKRTPVALTAAFAVATAAVVAVAAPAAAGPWPDHAVTVVVPFPAGGSTDMVARAVAQKLNEKLGQPFVVENRPGGGGSIGMGQAMRARPEIGSARSAPCFATGKPPMKTYYEIPAHVAADDAVDLKFAVSGDAALDGDRVADKGCDLGTGLGRVGRRDGRGRRLRGDVTVNT